jgi:nucleoside-diphosphate-sugar epimerase
MTKLDCTVNKKILVTGSSGFIGTNLVNRLKVLNVDVLGIDKKLPIKKNLDVHKTCDLNDYSELLTVFEEYRPEIVIHLAARTDLDGSSLEDYKDNTEAVENLCEAIVQFGDCSRVLFSSSMLVCVAGYKPKSDIDYCPSTTYGHSKVVTENIINSYAEQLPEYVIFRPTSIWGEFFNEPYRDFFEMVLARRFIRIGNKAKKTYGYVGNTCNQILSLSSCNEYQKVYYLGDEELNADSWSLIISLEANVKKSIKLPFLLIKLAALFGDFLKIIDIKFPLTSFRLRNMTTSNIYNPLPVKDINIFPEISLKDGVRKTIFFLNNEKIVNNNRSK